MKVAKILNEDVGRYSGWLEERYGNHAAQISIDTKLKLRSACKDVSRALRKRCDACGAVYSGSGAEICQSCARPTRGYVLPEIEALTKRFKNAPQGVDDRDYVLGYVSAEGHNVLGTSVPGHAESDAALIEYISRYPEDWRLVLMALGLPRQKGRHPCGWVIANKPIVDFIPLTTVSGCKVTAYTHDAVEAVGGVKMDFLGVNSLADIREAILLIQQRHPRDYQSQYVKGKLVPTCRLVPTKDGVLADIWDLPEEKDVFADIVFGRTETVFQFNTKAATQWLVHFRYQKEDGNWAINSIADMAAFTALDRPGPLDVELQSPDSPGKHNAMVEYARRARGLPRSHDIPPIFDELLPETYGVLVYQEQLQRIYQYFTGCSGSEAEEFRSNVAKKRQAKVDAAYPTFIARATAKVGAETAQAVWSTLITWAQYGFNLSHAVCYAATAYACAWLKHHYPLEWWCAVLKNASKDDIYDNFWPYIKDSVWLPDIRYSKDEWYIREEKLQAPLSLLHGLGEAARAAITQCTPCNSIEDFCQKLQELKAKNARNPVTRSVMYKMIVAGVMDSLFPPDTPNTTTDKMALYDKTAKRYKLISGRTRSYGTLDAIETYQVRKEILPIYSADLAPLVFKFQLPNITTAEGRCYYSASRWSYTRQQMVEVRAPLVGKDKLLSLASADKVPESGFWVMVPAYLVDVSPFQYGEQKAKSALHLTLDLDGATLRCTRWPGKDGALSPQDRDLKKGSVLVCVLVRRSADWPFAVHDYVMVKPPVSMNSESSD